MNNATSSHAEPAAGTIASASASAAQAPSGAHPSTARGGQHAAKNSDWQVKLAVFSQVGFGIAQFLVALCILGVYITSMYLMMQHRGDSDSQWDRLVFLFTGFEAIVFVAAGVIFGARVQRASVEAAQEESRRAREDLGAERERADRGAQLEEATANFIRALKAYADAGPQGTSNGHAADAPASHPNRSGARGPDGSTAAPVGVGGLNYAIRLAEELFSQGRR